MNPMHQMSSMMNSMLADPFGMFGGFGGPGRRGRGRQLMPFGFPNVNDILENFVSLLVLCKCTNGLFLLKLI